MFPDIADELVRMAEEDQRMRRASAGDRDKWDFSVDERNTARMRSIVAKIGWPTKSKLGELGEHKAWLLAQHADADREFQRHCLALMRDMPQREVCASHIAYLEDRVRLAQGRPQLYGTQLRSGMDGTLEPSEIEDPAHVDERRAAVGLSTLTEYLEMSRRVFSKRSDPPAL